jgi:TolB-like protein
MDGLAMTPSLIPPSEKEAHLQKVLASSCFARAEQLRRILCWLGNRAIGGEDPPTEYEVGRATLRRPENFDPQTDSLVRKEMSRLRKRLGDYYRTEGEAESIRMRCTDGYRLLFEWQAGAAPLYEDRASPPRLLALPLHVTPDLQEFASTFLEELLFFLSAAGDFRLLAQTTALRVTASATDIRRLAAETNARYLLEGTVRRRSNLVLVTLWLVDGFTGVMHPVCRLAGDDMEHLAAQAASTLKGVVQA